MSEESDRFRNRAKQCRQLAEEARDEDSRQTLNTMAADAEADQIDAETAAERDRNLG